MLPAKSVLCTLSPVGVLTRRSACAALFVDFVRAYAVLLVRVTDCR